MINSHFSDEIAVLGARGFQSFAVVFINVKLHDIRSSIRVGKDNAFFIEGIKENTGTGKLSIMLGSDGCAGGLDIALELKLSLSTNGLVVHRIYLTGQNVSDLCSFVLAAESINRFDTACGRVSSLG